MGHIPLMNVFFVSASSVLLGHRQCLLVARIIEKQRQYNSYTIMNIMKNRDINTAKF